MAQVELAGYDELLRELDKAEKTLGHEVRREAAKAAGEVVAARARQLCPVGDPAHEPDKKPLRDTIAVEIRDYGQRTLAVIGPQYPAGAHGHLLEYGHEGVAWGKPTGRRVGPRPFMRPAFDETKSEQQSAMEGVVADALRKL